jgi:hypothetical protein
VPSHTKWDLRVPDDNLSLPQYTISCFSGTCFRIVSPMLPLSLALSDLRFEQWRTARASTRSVSLYAAPISAIQYVRLEVRAQSRRDSSRTLSCRNDHIDVGEKGRLFDERCLGPNCKQGVRGTRRTRGLSKTSARAGEAVGDGMNAGMEWHSSEKSKDRTPALPLCLPRTAASYTCSAHWNR